MDADKSTLRERHVPHSTSIGSVNTTESRPGHSGNQHTASYRTSPLRHERSRESSVDELARDVVSENNSSSTCSTVDDDVGTDPPPFVSQKVEQWIYRPGNQKPPVLSTAASTASPSYGLERLVGRGRDDSGQDVYVVERRFTAEDRHREGAFSEQFTIPLEEVTNHVSVAELEIFEHQLDKEEKEQKAVEAAAVMQRRKLNQSLKSVEDGKRRGRGRPAKLSKLVATEDVSSHEFSNPDFEPSFDRSHDSEDARAFEEQSSDEVTSATSELTDVPEATLTQRVIPTTGMTVPKPEVASLKKRGRPRSWRRTGSEDKKTLDAHLPLAKRQKSTYLLETSTSSENDLPRPSVHIKLPPAHPTVPERRKEISGTVRRSKYFDRLEGLKSDRWIMMHIVDVRPAEGFKKLPDSLPEFEYLVRFQDADPNEDFWMLEEELVLHNNGLLSSYVEGQNFLEKRERDEVKRSNSSFEEWMKYHHPKDYKKMMKH